MREKSDSKEKEGEKKEEKKSNSTADVTLEKKGTPEPCRYRTWSNFGSLKNRRARAPVDETILNLELLLSGPRFDNDLGLGSAGFADSFCLLPPSPHKLLFCGYECLFVCIRGTATYVVCQKTEGGEPMCRILRFEFRECGRLASS